MKVFFLPLEPLEERYTAQMLNWVRQALQELNTDYEVVMPSSNYKAIQHGQWLDTFGTTKYRNLQMNIVAGLFEQGKIHEGDLFLVGDVWYPGIENIKLMAELSNFRVKVAGWHYAGTADPADLLHRATSSWAYTWEHWLVNNYLDAICVGSQFHANMLGKAFGAYDNVYPFGLAWRPEEVKQYFSEYAKQKIVVFPHRIAPEKNPEGFYKLAEIFKDKGWRFVVSTNNPHVADTIKNPYVEVVCHKSKEEYYRFLNTCSIYYSNATQETFGYALHEAIALGLSVVAPDRCSYSEMLENDPRFLYNPQRDPLGLNLLDAMMDYPIPTPIEYTLRWNASEITFLAKLLS